MENKEELAKSAEMLRKYHVASSLTGASKSILQQNPLPMPSPDIEFNKAKRIPLPYFKCELETTYDELMNKELNTSSSKILSLESVSDFLMHTCGVTVLKLARLKEGGELYGARASPSSGGLYPSEMYLLLPPGLVEGENGALVAHYHPTDHALQIRATFDASVWNELKLENTIVVCGTSLYWREVWKYGSRGFRYSLVDAGHLMTAAIASAKILSWEATLQKPAEEYSTLFGLNRKEDFPELETHDLQFLLVVGPTKASESTLQSLQQLSAHAPKFSWSGPAKPTSPAYHTKVLKEVLDAAACSFFTKQQVFLQDPAPIQNGNAGEATQIGEKVLATITILRRRSAHNFQPQKRGRLPKGAFYRMLERTVPSSPSCQLWKSFPSQKMDSLWLVIYVHRVEGLKQGLYVLFRQNLAPSEALGRAQNFQNAINLPSPASEKTPVCQPDGCPSHLHLYMLLRGSLTQYAAKISVSQSLCGNGSFLISMMADIPREVQQWGSSHYRTLHFEAGVIGQLLYLEATAIEMGATGVGAFFDEAANAIFNGSAKTIYHFAVGKPTEDYRVEIPVIGILRDSISKTGVVSTNCVCGKEAPHLCARCKGIKYCSQDCQKSHWPTHKSTCAPPPTSYSYAAEVLRDFIPKKVFTKESLKYEIALRRGEYPDSFYLPPKELFGLASLHPIPESTKDTSAVPIQYFQRLQQVQGSSPEAKRKSNELFLKKAIPIMNQLGITLDPAKQHDQGRIPYRTFIARYKRLYEAATYLTFASTFQVDRWEFYCSRALVFCKMHEFELAWEDCMRCISVVKTGFTSAPPPKGLDDPQIEWTADLADDLAYKIGLVSIEFGNFEDDDIMEFFTGTGTSHGSTDAKVAAGRASDVSDGESWHLGIKEKDTVEFLRILDNIPGINTDAHGNRRAWRKFPAIMKHNYQNFTSHPTDAKDPRVYAWKSTLQWLEEQYLQAPCQPLTIEFLLELNSRCGNNDSAALLYEKEVWGHKAGERVSAVRGFRKFAHWMRHGNPRIPSSKEIAVLAQINEKLYKMGMGLTAENYTSKFTPEELVLLAEFYHTLTPPDEILPEMQKLVALANSEEFRKLHPVQRAAILGVRLVSIHPFDDANGRTQQLLMGLELMREGYPPLVRREMVSYYKYVQHDIREFEPNCEVFTRWCAVNIALAMMGSDVPNRQLQFYAEKLFVENVPFDVQWANGHSNLAPPAELNAATLNSPNSEPSNIYKEYWLHAHGKRSAFGEIGDPNALPQGMKDKLTVGDIDELALKNSILHGKWILEVEEERINAVWQCIAKAVSSNALSRSSSAKTSTAAGFGVPPNFYAHYIVCVYTKNYLDVEDVMAAAADLKNLLVNANLTKGIGAVRYKPDIYTHLGFYGSQNDTVEEWRYTYSFV